MVGYCDDPVQQGYLSYYKMGSGPFYLFYRPYHLCHFETPWAIASLCLAGRPILAPRGAPVAEVVAVAKQDLSPGVLIPLGIGGEHVYGLIERGIECRREGAVPVCLVNGEDGPAARLRRRVPKDALATWDDLDLAGSPLLDLYRTQQRMLESA